MVRPWAMKCCHRTCHHSSRQLNYTNNEMIKDGKMKTYIKPRPPAPPPPLPSSKTKENNKKKTLFKSFVPWHRLVRIVVIINYQKIISFLHDSKFCTAATTGVEDTHTPPRPKKIWEPQVLCFVPFVNLSLTANCVCGGGGGSEPGTGTAQRYSTKPVSIYVAHRVHASMVPFDMNILYCYLSMFPKKNQGQPSWYTYLKTCYSSGSQAMRSTESIW